MRRSARIFALLLVIVALLVLTACADGESAAPAAVEGAQVRVSGSGTCLPLLRILSSEYLERHPDAEVEFVFLPGLHSGGGIKGVANGDLDLGAVSRDLTEEESALGLEYHLLSRDGLVIAVHPSVTIEGLTTEQVRAIYRGDHANWSELGGPDLPIVILDRNEDESAKIILRQYVLGPDLEITSKAVNLYYEPDMIDGLQSTSGAIGYFSLGYGISQDVPVRYLRLDGAQATVANIEAGTYEMVRPLGMVTSPEASEALKAFVEWSSSDEAHQVMESAGFAPAD